jgi:hypothetical protein
VYIIDFRNNNPNAGYKRFYNKHLQPKILVEYKNIFHSSELINKELYYEIIKQAGLERRITKRKKRIWINEQYKKA